MNSSNSYKHLKEVEKKIRAWYSSTGFLLLILPFFAIPATIKAFITGNLAGIIINASGYALYLFSASLLRRGLIAEAIYQEKGITRAPKWPFKTWAAILVALTTFFMAWLGAHHTFWVAIAFGLGALLGMYLSYGFDPRAEKNGNRRPWLHNRRNH